MVQKSLKPIKITLAPMEGVVDPVIREIFSLIGGYDLMFTEFIRVTDKLNPESVFYRYSPELNNYGKTRYGTPVVVQLLGSDPHALYENAMRALELGSPGVDLNFGCPAKTVNRHDGGAALLKEPRRVFKLLNYLVEKLPQKNLLSAKIRLGFNDTNQLAFMAEGLREIPLRHLTVHARTKAQGYKPPAHWEDIGDHFSNFPYPVYANGDIWDYASWLKCQQVTGLHHFALGRGAFALPNLGIQIKNDKPVALSWSLFTQELLPLFKKLSIEHKNEHFALCRLKQWLKFLGRNYPQASQAFEKIKTQQKLSKELNSFLI